MNPGAVVLSRTGAATAADFSNATGAPIVGNTDNGRLYWFANGQPFPLTVFTITGVVGDGVTDDTAAIQTALNTLTPTTGVSNAATGNGVLFLPRGTYRITDTLVAPNSASQYMLVGEGRRATVLKWDGAAGIPMMKMINAREVVIDSIGFFGNATNKPSHGIQVYRQLSGQVGAAAPGFCKFSHLFLGGDSANMLDKGIAYNCASGSDQNNEQGVFFDVMFANITDSGASFEHLNSLLHKLYACLFDTCGVAISNIGDANSSVANVGGSFKTYGCVGGACTLEFKLYVAEHAIDIHGWSSEGSTALINTPIPVSGPRSLIVSFHDMDWSGANGTAITFDAVAGHTLNFFGGFITAPLAINMSFPTAGSRVNIYGGAWNIASISYANEVSLDHVYEFQSAPTYTNTGTGTLMLNRSDGSSRLNAMAIFTAGATPSVDGLANQTVLLNYAAPTTITGFLQGFVGQVVTFIANNGNATIQHGTGTGNVRLQGAANFGMASSNSLTIRRLDATVGDSWIEIGRKT